MKHLLLTTIAAVVLVGCGKSVTDVSIHYAAEDGNFEAVKQHLAAGVDVNSKEGKVGVTILHCAVQGGQKEIVELLIKNGADVNAKEFGSCSNIAGFEPGNPAIGIGLNSYKLINPQTPLDWANNANEDDPLAIKSAKEEIATLLGKHGGKTGVQLSIYTAVANGNIEAVKKHLVDGNSVNAKDADGRTPLDWAVRFTQTEIADLLRKHGGKTGEELKSEVNKLYRSYEEQN